MGRRTSGSIPSYRFHKARGCAVVTIDGKDHYLGSFESRESRDKYDRLIAEWLERGRCSPGPILGTVQGVSGPGVTINQLILSYWHHSQEFYCSSPSELVKIKLAVRPLRRLYGMTPAVQFGPLALRAVREKMLELQRRTIAPREKEGKSEVRVVEYRLSRRTINQRIGLLKRMFKWASGVELVPVTVYQALSTVESLEKGRTAAPDHKKVRPVDQVLIEATLPRVNRHIQGMINFQRLTGARPGEVCRIRESEIDMTGMINGIPVWLYRPSQHKNEHRDHDRVIYIGPKAQEVLKAFFTESPEEYLFSPHRATQERYAELRSRRRCKLYPSSDSRRKRKPKRKPGRRYTVWTYRQAVQRACKKAGISPWNPHQLRHTAATYLRKEYGVETARIILGHRHLSATEIYAEPSQRQAMEVMAKLG